MIRSFENYEVYLAVVSAGRADRAATMNAAIGPATWHVPVAEVDAYRDAGCDVVADSSEAGNVSVGRNSVLDSAGDRTCVMLDDEIGPTYSVKLDPSGNLIRTPITFPEGVTQLLDRLEMTGLRMAAGTHITNGMFLKQMLSGGNAVQHRITIQGGCLAIKPSTPRFDPEILFHEDLDFTLQHWEAYGGALRVNDVLFIYTRGTAGGVRTEGFQRRREEAAAKLVEKWPGLLRLNPKDPGDVKLIRRTKSRRKYDYSRTSSA